MKDLLHIEQGESLLKELLKGGFYLSVIQDVLRDGACGENEDSRLFFQNILESLQREDVDFSSPPPFEEIEVQASILCRGQPHFFKGLLLIWRRIHRDLWERIRDFFPPLSSPSFSSFQDSQKNLEYCSRLAGEFHLTSPQFSWAEVLFMTTLYLVHETNVQKKNQLSSSTREWQHILHQIGSWTPFHGSWAYVESFIHQLRQLASAKLSFKERQVEELDEALLELKKEREMVEYFDLERLSSFQLEDISQENLKEVNYLLFRLKESIHQYRHLFKKHPENIFIRRKLDERLFYLEEDTRAIYEKLLSSFQKVKREENPPLHTSTREDGSEEGSIYPFIEEGDFSLAYWMAVWKNQEELALLCRAVQGSWWFPHSHGSLYGELKSLFSNREERGSMEKMMLFAAALLLAFFAPEILSLDLLEDPLGLPELQSFIEDLVEFIESGLVLRFEDLPGYQGQQVEIDELSRKARDYLKGERREDLSYHSSLILQELLKPGSDLNTILTLVAEDERYNYQDLEPLLKEWEGEERIEGHLKHFFLQEVHGHLKEYLLEMLAVVHSWYYLVSREALILKSEGYYKTLERISNLVIIRVPPMIWELETLLKDTSLEPGVQCGIHAIKGSLQELVALFTPKREEESSAWWFLGSSSLREALERRLLWFPYIDSKASNPPSEEVLKEIYVDSPSKKPMRDELERTISQREERGDYDSIETILSILPPETRKEVGPELEERRKKRELEIHSKARSIKELLERVYQGGLIEEEERMEKEGALLLPEEIDYFPPLEERLERMEGELTLLLERAMKERAKIFEEMKTKLKESSIPFLSTINKAFRMQDLLGLDRYLEALNQYIESREVHLFPNIYLQTFFRQMNSLERYAISDSRFRLLLRSLHRGLTWGDMNFQDHSKAHVEKGEEALKAYIVLKRRRLSKGESFSAIETILSFLGFTLHHEEEKPLQILQEQNSWIHLQVHMSTGSEGTPFPQFGSSKTSYQLFCLQAKLGTDSLGSLLSQSAISQGQVLFIIFLGRLTGYQRHQLLKASQEKGVVSVVLDELLFLHLLGRESHRSEAFLHISLPFSAINPYRVELERGIPKEVFYGRSQEISQIIERGGMTYLCGGWKIGKSALLYHIEKTFHSPKRKQYALVSDLQELGIEEDPMGLWEVLSSWIEKWGLSIERSRDPHLVTSSIARILTENPESKFLIMLDNADSFLTALKENPKVLSSLKELTHICRDRLHLVFTGNPRLLHYFQYQDSSIEPLLLGPLQVPEARDLLERPLEYLSFTLEDEVRQSILRATDGHPYLMKTFCFLLLKRLYENHERFRDLRNGGMTILAKDVEALYPSILKHKREGLEETMALHPKYKALLLGIMAQRGSTKRDPKRYSPKELLELCSYLWPEEFGGLREEEMERLMQELTILRVLSPVGEREYIFSHEELLYHYLDRGIEERIEEVSSP